MCLPALWQKIKQEQKDEKIHPEASKSNGFESNFSTVVLHLNKGTTTQYIYSMYILYNWNDLSKTYACYLISEW